MKLLLVNDLDLDLLKFIMVTPTSPLIETFFSDTGLLVIGLNWHQTLGSKRYQPGFLFDSQINSYSK